MRHGITGGVARISLILCVASCAVLAKSHDKKKDPDEIGNRDVGKGINFYSLEKEIALGKQMAQEVEKQAGSSTIP
jgi:hypothetical protein